MVGCVKYGLDCWMMDVEGKCNADAVARGLPACTWAGRKGHQGGEDGGDALRKRESGQEQGRDQGKESEGLASGVDVETAQKSPQ